MTTVLDEPLRRAAAAPRAAGAALRIIRVISRLNIGGPAIQAVLLSDRLQGGGFSTLLVTGDPDPAEGDMSYLLAGTAVRQARVPSLRRAIRPWRDARAAAALMGLLWRERPHVVHTHAAKAGALGRTTVAVYNVVAAWDARRRGAPFARCRTVHTFHGHVLEGYFSPFASRMFLAVERWLGARTDCLVTVSEAVREDLIRRGVAGEGRVRVIPLGLPLEPFLRLPEPAGRSGPLRLGCIGRLVPIKNHQLLLEAVARARAAGVLVELDVIGNGELRAGLEAMAARTGLAGAVRFRGWVRNVAETYADLDAVCLTSLNEGTPVSLIESLAAARPVVATDVGGVRDVLGAPAGVAPAAGACAEGAHGWLARSGDADGLVAAFRRLAVSVEHRQRMGRTGRVAVQARYGSERLVRDMQALYKELAG